MGKKNSINKNTKKSIIKRKSNSKSKSTSNSKSNSKRKRKRRRKKNNSKKQYIIVPKNKIYTLPQKNEYNMKGGFMIALLGIGAIFGVSTIAGYTIYKSYKHSTSTNEQKSIDYTNDFKLHAKSASINDINGNDLDVSSGRDYLSASTDNTINARSATSTLYGEEHYNDLIRNHNLTVDTTRAAAEEVAKASAEAAVAEAEAATAKAAATEATKVAAAAAAATKVAAAAAAAATATAEAAAAEEAATAAAVAEASRAASSHQQQVDVQTAVAIATM
jgi:hypothetical protein